MSNPRLLLLDEVSLGLAPVAVADVYRSLVTVIEGGTTVVLVEQDLTRALDTAQRVVCMLEGRLVLEGRADELTREQIADAYFGLHRSGGGVARA
jgi:branched-chain amino acid transport system ATP-binding protein